LNIFETPKSFRHFGSYAPLLAFADGVPADGFYQIKVTVEAMNRRNSARFPPMDPAEPFRLGVVPGNQKAGFLHYPQPIEPLLAETAPGDNGPESHPFTVWLDAGYTPRFTFPNGMMNAQPALRNIDGSPHIRIHEVVIRGPLYDNWPTDSQQLILGGKPFEAG